MAKGQQKPKFAARTLPQDGIELSIPEGKELTRIHLDIANDGIILATVGAGSGRLAPGNRHKIILKPSKDGISLAVVGAASAAK